MNKAISAPFAFIIIILLAVIVGGLALERYYIFIKTSEMPSVEIKIPNGQAGGENNNTLESLPVIDSITPNSGPIGTIINIKGKNFSGFEGDLIAWIENSKGEKGILYSINQYTGNPEGSTLIKTKIEAKLCTTDNSYSGLPCEKYLNIIPGAYKIFTSPWGNKSNVLNFTVTQ